MKEQTVAAASGLPFETINARLLPALLFVPLLLPPLQPLLRAVVRPWVLHHVANGMIWVQRVQSLRNPLLTALCSWTSWTVSVEFYVTFLPVLIWTIYPQLGWRLVFLLAFALYVGNAMKDLVSAPRPAGAVTPDGGVVVTAHLQTAELAASSKEYGLPSSHTLNSCVLNYYAIYFCLEKELISTATGRLLYVAASCWIAFIAFARMYLGMHTPIDLLGGMLGGVAVLNFYITVDEEVESFIINAGPATACICMLLACMLLLRAHPLPMRHTPSYEYSVAFVGVAFGLATAVSRSYGTHLMPGPVLLELWEAAGLLGILRRAALGFLLVAANHIVAQKVMMTIIPPFYKLYPMAVRRLWQPPMHSLTKSTGPDDLAADKDGLPWDVHITVRHAAYASIGWTVCDLAPKLFQLLGW